MNVKVGALVRYISSDDSFEVIVDLGPDQSLVEAIADTGISQHEAWNVIEVWIHKEVVRPTRGGQAVKEISTGKVGITTDAPMARSPRIGVMFLGANYSVICQLDDLEVVEIEVKS